MSDRLEGWLFPRGAARREAAQLAADAGQIVLRRGDGSEERLDPATLRVSGRLANVPRRLTLADGRVFETADNDGVDRLLGGHRQHRRGTRLAQLERFHPRLILAGLATLFLIFAVVRWGVPVAGDAAVTLVPHAVEAAVADSALSFLDDIVFEPSRLPAARRERIEALFADLAAGSDLPPGRLQLHFRAGGGLGANAFALPGGPVVLTDEMVAMAPGDEALAGVLAHEIGHVEQRHGLKRLARAAGLAATMLLLTGDASGLLEDASLLPALLLDLSYSRDFEREADGRAITLLQATGRSPAALATLFERLLATCEPRCADESWFSSHPPTRERIEALRRAAEAQGSGP